MGSGNVGHAFAQLLALERGSTGGLQRQLYTAIRRAILEGVLLPGMRLPSTRALADDVGVSRTTTLLAYEQLLAEGYLDARHGSGTFVARELPDYSPHDIAARPAGAALHPPLSRRGELLAAIPPPARRLAGPPRPFRIGVPALDLFPMRLWSQFAAKCIRACGGADLDYGDPAGLLALRNGIARHVSIARGTRCTPDQILIVAGAQRGLDLMCRLLLDVGDAAWLEDPGYAGARSALVGANAHVVPVPVDDEGLDVAAGVKLAPNARLAYVTPSHQYPLGVTMSVARRHALLEWARAAGAWILEDDYDSEFSYGAKAVPALHALDSDGRVIYVGSFSKSLFPSLRLGFVIVPPDLMPQLVAARTAADVHPSGMAQAIVAEFIDSDHYDRHLRRMRRVYRERLAALKEALDRSCGGAVRLRPVSTGLHAVADLTAAAADAVADECAARGVEVTPLTAYAINPLVNSNALVLGFAAVPADDLRQGAQSLADAIDAARKHESNVACSL